MRDRNRRHYVRGLRGKQSNTREAWSQPVLVQDDDEAAVVVGACELHRARPSVCL